MVVNVDQFTKRLKDLLGETENADYSIPIAAVKRALEYEVYLLDMERNARFMYELR